MSNWFGCLATMAMSLGLMSCGGKQAAVDAGVAPLSAVEAGGPVNVAIRARADGFELLRDGAPYVVRGAGLGVDAPDAQQMMEELQRHGGNSLRTWNVGDGAFLDQAHALGLTVSVCLDIKRERHGFDYGDAAAVKAQFEQARTLVLAHRNHPAILSWIIGNELNHDYSDPRVYDAVNDISKMIHALDPNHPTTSTTAGINSQLAAVLQERASDLDFFSVQTYGGLFGLADTLAAIDLKRPLMVTEWGTIGHWEVPTTQWGAPIELSSSEKAETYRRGYTQVLSRLGGNLIGSYAFLWGQKQERTPTWYGLFVDGHTTEATGVLQRWWTGRNPVNRAPTVGDLRLDNRQAADNVRLRSGSSYQAQVTVNDPDGDSLEYRWQLLNESQATQSGGDPEEVPADRSSGALSYVGDSAELRAPAEPGAYRLFVYAYDGRGAVAHANLPFYVFQEQE